MTSRTTAKRRIRKRNQRQKVGGASAADVNEQQRKHEEMEEKQRQEEDEDEAQEIEAGSWPFTRTCEFLAFSLFSSRWEDRTRRRGCVERDFAVPSGMCEYFHRNVRYYYDDKC